MKIKITLVGSRYQLVDTSSEPAVYINRGGKPVYFTKRGAAESFVKARAAQGWELTNA